MALSWPFKDPDEVLDYDIDWTARLYSADELALVDAGQTVMPADTISSSIFMMPQGATLVKNSSTFASTRTKVWLSGGDEGQTYLIQNRIVTAGGRTMDQTVKLKVKTK